MDIVLGLGSEGWGGMMSSEVMCAEAVQRFRKKAF